jgi:hypothetical protein
VPELDGVVYPQPGHAEQRRIVDPAAKQRVRFQALNPPGMRFARLVFPRRAERLGVVFQTFEAQLAIVGDIVRCETAHLDKLRRDGGI